MTSETVNQPSALREALMEIRQWCKAYPLKVFPKPDLEKAAKVLAASGMTLDAISADAMRHVLDGVADIVDAALSSPEAQPNDKSYEVVMEERAAYGIPEAQPGGGLVDRLLNDGAVLWHGPEKTFHADPLSLAAAVRIQELENALREMIDKVIWGSDSEVVDRARALLAGRPKPREFDENGMFKTEASKP